MSEYCRDDTKDMHRDQAMDIFIMTPEEIKWYKDTFGYKLRYLAKNRVVFAFLYGDYFIKGIGHAK